MKIPNLFPVIATVLAAVTGLFAYENDHDYEGYSGRIDRSAAVVSMKSPEPVVLRPGETVHSKTSTREPQLFRVHLDAGTSVEITYGQREIGLFVRLYDQPVPQPENDEWIRTNTIQQEVVSPEGVAEPFVVVAERSGDYILRIAFFSSGEFSFTCSTPHATTTRDLRYAEANRAHIPIRLAFENGQPLYTAREQIERRAAIYRELGDHKSLGLALMDQALMYVDSHQIDDANRCFDEAKTLFEKANSPADVDRVLNMLAHVNENWGNYQQVVDLRGELLDRARLAGSKQKEYGGLFSLGVFYHRLGDAVKAREFYDRAFELARSVDPPNRDSLSLQAVYYTNLGNLCRGMNGSEIPIPFFPPPTRDDYRQALGFLKKAEEVNEGLASNYPGYPNLLKFNQIQIANTHKELGNYDEALALLNELLEPSMSSQNPDKRLLTRLYLLIGSVYARQGNVAKTVENFDRETALLREGVNEGDRRGYLLTMAGDYYKLGELQRSETLFNEAADLGRRRSGTADIAESLLGIARIERDLGNFNNARSSIEEALQLQEGLRSRITNNELRTLYFSSVKRFYDFYVELLMQSRTAEAAKGLDALALQASEKGRSRSLLDLLAISGVDLRKGIDPAMIEREKRTREQLMTKADQQTRLMLRKHTDLEADRVRAEMLELTTTYENIQTELRNKSPKYAALAPVNALSVKQIQALLDPGTALLEYALGERKSFLWVVTRDSLTSFDLAPKEEIETTARQAYNFVTERNRRAKVENVNKMSARRRLADAEYTAASALLSEKLLGPAADIIRNKRLVIVPDGALGFISFASLPEPGSGTAGAAVLLGSDHEIVMLPSASTLAALRDGEQNRAAAPKTLAIFADPVFDRADNRATTVNGISVGSRTTTTRDFERAVSDVGLNTTGSSSLPRLPFSRREADAIFAAAPRFSSVKNVDFDASKQNVFVEPLDRYRIIHFASHSLLDSDHPDLSGIVLSLVGRNGQAVDGFLRLRDVYDLKLNADMVVLSACNTALGAEVRGEGLIGLTRGFMYAGTSRVVASLWKVDDAATAELMSVFYRNIFKEQMRPAAALRAAQSEIRKQPRWSSPYYWAPFVLQGDWR